MIYENLIERFVSKKMACLIKETRCELVPLKTDVLPKQPISSALTKFGILNCQNFPFGS